MVVKDIKGKGGVSLQKSAHSPIFPFVLPEVETE